MRGNRRLIQSISVVGLTGVLAFSATVSTQITRSEETVQIADNGTAGVIAEFTQDNLYLGSLSIEQLNVTQVGSGVSGVTAATYDMTAEAVQNAADSEEATEKQETEKQDTGNTEKEAKESTESTEEKSAESTEEKSAESTGEEGTESTEEESTETEAKATKEKTTKETKKSQKSESTDSEKATDKEEKNKTTTKEDTKTTTTKKSTEKTDEETKSDKTLAKWENKLMADVDDFLYIRKAGNKDSKILGKLRKGDVATVLKQGKTWTKIKSGTVTGYVKNKYCVYGTKAYKLAQKVCDTYAKAKTDGLRIRSKASKKASVLEVVEKGEKLTVNTDAKEKDGWVAVTTGTVGGYVSEEYVSVALGTGKAISLEEEKKQLEAQKKAEGQVSSSLTQNISTSVTSDELTLLAAIIHCEAGGESYTGQVAVGAVVLNRVRSSSFPNSISQVIRQSGQFTPVASGAFASALSNGTYQHCIAAAQAALAGNDPTGGAKYFHRNGGNSSGLVIGHHVFY